MTLNSNNMLCLVGKSVTNFRHLERRLTSMNIDLSQFYFGMVLAMLGLSAIIYLTFFCERTTRGR